MKTKWLLSKLHPCKARIPSGQQRCKIFTSSLCMDTYIAQNLVILTLSPGHQWHSWSSHLQQTQRIPSCHPWLLAWRWGSVYKAAAHAETQWSAFLSSVSAQSGYGIFHWKKWRKSLCPIPPCQTHTSEFSHWPQAIVLVLTPLLPPSLKGSFLAFLRAAWADALWASWTGLTLSRKQLCGKVQLLLPVESGMLHQCISVPIFNDHFAAHTSKALRVILVFASHLQTEEGVA